MITNRDDYMKFRLGTFSKEGDEPEKKEPEQETQPETETPAEGEEKKPETEEKSGEASQEGELETHSVRSVFWDEVVSKMIERVSVAETKIVSYIVALILIALSKLNLDAEDLKTELESAKALSKKEDVTEEDITKIKEILTNAGEIVSSEMVKESTSAEVLDDIRNAMAIAQKEAKEAGIETGVQTYSKMKVYSKVDTIKAALYLDELGWEKVTPNGYLVPGTDQMIKIWTDENTDDTMTEVDGADGKVIGVQQSFEDFKDFVDRLIRNGVGSYSDEDEQTDAIEVAESRDEQGYSEDEIADKAEELEKEVEELKKDVAELKGEEPKSEETKPEGETATNSEGICPECGKEPCECVKPEGELETKSDFATRLMEKLNRG